MASVGLWMGLWIGFIPMKKDLRLGVGTPGWLGPVVRPSAHVDLGNVLHLKHRCFNVC